MARGNRLSGDGGIFHLTRCHGYCKKHPLLTGKKRGQKSLLRLLFDMIFCVSTYEPVGYFGNTRFDSVYSILARLDTYRAEISQQIRQVLADGVSTDNPILTFAPKAKFVLNDAV